MAEFTIGELARLTDVSIQTLRYYDRIGLFKPVQVDEQNNYRYYDVPQLFQLNTIKYLRYLGLSIQKIEQLLQADGPQQVTFLQQQDQQIDAEIQRLQAIKQLLHGQQQQLALKQQLKTQLGQIYQRQLPRQRFAKQACATIITPKDRPDVAVSQLVQLVKKAGTRANLQYGCAYPLGDYEALTAIHYQYLFTQLFDDHVTLPAENQLILPAGTYLGVAFHWSHAVYLDYLQQLKSAYVARQGRLPATVYEVSLLDGYDYQNDASFITELRVRLD